MIHSLFHVYSLLTSFFFNPLTFYVKEVFIRFLTGLLIHSFKIIEYSINKLSTFLSLKSTAYSNKSQGNQNEYVLKTVWEEKRSLLYFILDFISKRMELLSCISLWFFKLLLHSKHNVFNFIHFFLMLLYNATSWDSKQKQNHYNLKIVTWIIGIS